MTTTYRIHPAIGIARVGNSPDEFFVGPELLGDRPRPQGGFKDDQCRVKRQAVRFRIFAHDDVTGTSTEVTAADADIEWTVHVANSKAAYPGRGNFEPAADLTIDPGSRTLSTPGGRALFDTGAIHFSGQPSVPVPLGEMRTDDDGRLLVLGGFGASASPAGNNIFDFWASPGWHDDVSDGPVSATLTLHGSGDTPPVEGAWVIVGPPKFAPHQDSVTTLYDRIQQQMIDSGLDIAPTSTSYTRDIYPILQRARDTQWVEKTFGAHAWADPVTNQVVIDSIVARIANPAGGGGDMPELNGADSRVTPTQYAHLLRWQAGDYAQDWIGVPPVQSTITSAGLDQAALEACVGGAFYPGIEAGGRAPGQRPILEKPYAASLRLDHSLVQPGDITASMALPWQADFKACGDNWWPVPRPNDVRATSTGPVIRWDRNVTSMQEMVTEWNLLGFVVDQGGDKLETQHCAEQSIVLLTPHLDFVDVAAGPMGMVREVPLAITFEVVSPASALTLEYDPAAAPSHPQLVAVTSSVTVGPTAPNAVASARLWIVFQTDAVGSSIPTQTVTVREPVSGRTWQVTIDGNTVARRTTATALALDRSGSMSEDRGDGQSKHDSLQQAANVFIDLMLDGDGAGIARFNGDAQVLQPVLPLGNGSLSDLNRSAIHDVINGPGLDPAGATSIGDGIAAARGALDAAPGFDSQALVVLTDGLENRPRWIADVSGSIDARTYAVGFGQPHNISVPALQRIADNNGGYLLTTGAITGDRRFLLQKYFLQILSGITNTEVVLDPDGVVTGDQVLRIPFQVSDADTGIEVVILVPKPQAVDFRVETPTGQLIEPWLAIADQGMHFGFSDGAAFYRVALPTQLTSGRFDHAGTWHAVVTIGKPRVGDNHDKTDPSVFLARPAVSDRPVRQPREFERRFALAHSGQRTTADNGLAAPPGGHGPDHGSTAISQRRMPFSLIVHAYSALSLAVDIDQDGYHPGSMVIVRARLTQSGLPVEDAMLWVEVQSPSGGHIEVGLEARRTEWAGEFMAAEPGVYRARVRARGRTRSGAGFHRERTLTATVWRGAGRPGDLAGESHTPSSYIEKSGEAGGDL